jgi:hypothetical protein
VHGTAEHVLVRTLGQTIKEQDKEVRSIYEEKIEKRRTDIFIQDSRYKASTSKDEEWSGIKQSFNTAAKEMQSYWKAGERSDWLRCKWLRRVALELTA